jgi:hypothetical protein
VNPRCGTPMPHKRLYKASTMPACFGNSFCWQAVVLCAYVLHACHM